VSYGEILTHEDRSDEVYRLGGLIDYVDALQIAEALFIEIGLRPEGADRAARALFARLASADHGPLLVSRVYEVGEGDPA
jgi:hypothetical protein